MGIEADEVEMARYRARFATRLKEPRRLVSKWKPLVLAATAALLIFVFVPSFDKNEFANLELAHLEAMAGTASPELKARAQELLQGDPSIARSNALMLLCMTENYEDGILLAAQGVQQDRRPEFRFFFLEYLLENADEYSYNAARIEELMDSEGDEDCLVLYKSLLRIAT